MRELDQVEQRLKKQQAEIAQGLELIQATKKVINAIGPTKVTRITATATPAPKANGTKKKATVSAMSASAIKKQKAASREYWRKVKAGEIERKGYKGHV